MANGAANRPSAPLDGLASELVETSIYVVIPLCLGESLNPSIPRLKLRKFLGTRAIKLSLWSIFFLLTYYFSQCNLTFFELKAHKIQRFFAILN